MRGNELALKRANTRERGARPYLVVKPRNGMMGKLFIRLADCPIPGTHPVAIVVANVIDPRGKLKKQVRSKAQLVYLGNAPFLAVGKDLFGHWCRKLGARILFKRLQDLGLVL